MRPDKRDFFYLTVLLATKNKSMRCNGSAKINKKNRILIQSFFRIGFRSTRSDVLCCEYEAMADTRGGCKSQWTPEIEQTQPPSHHRAARIPHAETFARYGSTPPSHFTLRSWSLGNSFYCAVPRTDYSTLDTT